MKFLAFIFAFFISSSVKASTVSIDKNVFCRNYAIIMTRLWRQHDNKNVPIGQKLTLDR